MKNHVILALSAMTIMVATSCKKSYNLNVSAADQTGQLTICTRSTLTGSNLGGVKIAVVGSPKDTITTDANGVATLRLAAGSYELKLTANGYASIYSDPIQITPVNGESDTPIFGETHEDIDMYAIDATLSGRVVMQASGESQASYVQGATVALTDVGSSRLAEPILATTDAEGLFTMQVPVNAQLQPAFYYVNGGLNYSASISSVSLKKGETKMLTSTLLSPNVAGTYVADKVTAPKLPNEALVVTFPVAINPSAVKYNDGLILASGADSLQFSYADNNRTILITPLPRYHVTNPDQIASKKKWSVGSHNFSITGIKGSKGEVLNAGSSFTVKAE